MDIGQQRSNQAFSKVLAKSRVISHPNAKLPDRSVGPSKPLSWPSISAPAIVTTHAILLLNPISSTEHNSVVRSMVILDPRKDPS